MTLSTENILAVESLRTSFSGHVIHDNLSLEVKEREIVAIVGGSGAGKSVLIKSILGLLPVRSGRILYRGQTMDVDKFRSKCGIQFQNGALLGALTVGENIMLPLLYRAQLDQEDAVEIAYGKMQLVGLKPDDFHKYPNELSGGMIKRASLARAIALDPVLLFLDEPTSGLDPISSREYDHLIETLHAGLNVTVIMITHDLLRVHNLADRVIVIHNKRAFEGTYSEISNHADPEIRKYLEMGDEPEKKDTLD